MNRINMFYKLKVEALKHCCHSFITYLQGNQGCSHGIHGNSVAYSKSSYSSSVDSLQQMLDGPSLQLTPKRKSTILMTKPWLRVKSNVSLK